MKRSMLWAAMISAGLLAACDGGGNGGDSGGSGNAPSNTATVSMTGTAAKGLLANAVVTAHPVLNGTVDNATTLATTTTDPNGAYTLTFTATQSQPYVIKVTGGTYTDEASGAPVTLPANFSMRSLFIPTSTGQVTTRASITPFSEMAVSAAESASGGVTAANADRAVEVVRELLGFDPTQVDAVPAGSADTPAERALALMLTAVSQMANTSGTLGCSGATLAERTQCVVNTMADAANTSTLDLTTPGNVDVSAALATAVTTVLANPALAGSATAADVAIAVANLNCTGDACTPAPATPPAADPVAAGIAAAKQLFEGVRSDWTSLFASRSAVSPGALNVEASKFEDAMRGVQVPVEVALKDASALIRGIDLYNDYKAGRTTVPQVRRGFGLLSSADQLDQSNVPALDCRLYQDPQTSIAATAPDNANVIGCRAVYFFEQLTDPGTGALVPVQWRHGFTVVPDATTAGRFNYTARVRSAPFLPSSTADFSGTVTTTTDVPLGHITGFTISGELPAAFAIGSNVLVNDHHTWNLTATRTFGAEGATNTIQGTVVSQTADDAVLGTLTINEGSSLSEIAVSRDAQGNIVAPHSPAAAGTAGTEIAGATLNVVWTTPSTATAPGAEFAGTFAATESMWSKDLTAHVPTRVALTGAFRTVTGDARTEFLSGQMLATVTGFDQYNNDQPDTTSNFATLDLNFSGTATAPERPLLRFTLATSQRSYEEEPLSATLQYRSLAAGATTPKTVVNLAASRNSTGALSLTLSEPSSGLSTTVVEGAGTADLLLNGSTVIGTTNLDTGVLTFTDGSFISLDVGI